MDNKTPLLDLNLGHIKDAMHEIVRDIPPDHFMAAVDKRLITLGKEITGKDITNNADILCMRKTFDNSQKCRVDKEKMREVFLTEGTKKVFHWAVTAVLVGWLTFLKFGTG